MAMSDLLSTRRLRKPAAQPSPAKAREMLQHGEVKGNPLTGRQRRFFGAVMGRGERRRRRAAR